MGVGWKAANHFDAKLENERTTCSCSNPHSATGVRYGLADRMTLTRVRPGNFCTAVRLCFKWHTLYNPTPRGEKEKCLQKSKAHSDQKRIRCSKNKSVQFHTKSRHCLSCLTGCRMRMLIWGQSSAYTRADLDFPRANASHPKRHSRVQCGEQASSCYRFPNLLISSSVSPFLYYFFLL